MRVRLLGIFLLAFCLVSPVFAADRVIQNGIDVWMTKGDGKTFVDFAKTPIPAGFFCPGSAAFAGKVAFRGEPIVTSIPGALGKTDTIVQRLDNAEFDKRGVAVTRIQARALSLKSMEPVQTSCGKFDVSVALDGTQPTTRMRIIRDNAQGGRFSAPLALNTKMTFTPVGRINGETLEIAVPVRFPAAPNVPWRSRVIAPDPAGFVLVDTDGDRSPDTYLPGKSNFVAGKPSQPVMPRKPGLAVNSGIWRYYCHAAEGHEHCYWACEGDYCCEGCQEP